jgi:hypothetical protein
MLSVANSQQHGADSLLLPIDRRFCEREALGIYLYFSVLRVSLDCTEFRDTRQSYFCVCLPPQRP